MVSKKTVRGSFKNWAKTLAFVFAFAVTGTTLLILSGAATTDLVIESESGTITGPVAEISDAYASGGKALKFGSDTNQTITTIRAAFYYPWFPEAWNQQGYNPFTNFTPSLGFYSSTDLNIINKHIDEQIYAGMNSSIYSWWGQGSKEDNRFQSYLDATGTKPLKWALYHECEGNPSGGTCGSVGGPAPGVAAIQNDLSYIKTNYTADKNYLIFQGKPVIFVYGDGTDSCTTASNWETANNNLGSPFYIVLKVFVGYKTCPSQPDNWHQYGPASAEDVQAGSSIAISPGYWKRGCQPVNGGTCTQGGTQPYLARDLARWQQNVTNLKNSTNPLQLVTTFNEWGEGSIIESTQEWASASGHGAYIDVLHNVLVGTTTDTSAPSVPTNVSATAASPTQVNISWSASTDNVGIAAYEISRNGTLINTVGAVTTASDSTVTASTNYQYTIVAKDAAGNASPSSAPASVTTPAPSPCNTNPTAPTNLRTTGTVTGSSVGLAWNSSTPGSNCTLSNYLVFRSVTGGASTLAATLPASTLSWSDTGVSFSTSYSYYVIAQDSSIPPHQSPASTTLAVNTPGCSDAVAPTAPGGFGYSVTTTSVTLNWSASSDSGTCKVAGYKVYQVVGGSDSEKATIINGQPLSLTVTGLTAGTSYTFRVKAYDSSTAPNFSAASSVNAQTQTPSTDVTIAVAGDAQKPRSDLRYGIDTINIIKNQINPSFILGLGDLQYESGSLSDFQNYYDKTWGQAGVGQKVYPTPGNHEYGTSGASGYYSYFNAGNNTINGNTVTGPAGSGSGWYAFDINENWRVYSMNAETTSSTATTQNTFLSNDITANPRQCSIMFSHKPYYDYSTTHDGDGDRTLPWLKTFYDKNGDLVFTGHEHNYQRFKMANPYTDTEDTTRGLRTFVVGTGGADNLYNSFGSTAHSANTLISTWNGSSAWGVLKVVLHGSSYDWQFIPMNTNGYTDSGSGTCH